MMIIFILFGYPLLALIAARIYHSIKNLVINEGINGIARSSPQGKALVEQHERDDAVGS